MTGAATDRDELARQLAMSHSQLRRYAADMKQVVEAERARSRELAAANLRLARLDQLKSDFLAFISHELRTPLNHMAAVDLLDPEASPEDQAETVEIIRAGYARLNALISRGLDYLYWVSREPGSVAGSVHWPGAVEKAAGRVGISIEFDRPADSPLVQGDEEPWIRVFAELLGNARAHGPSHGVIRVTNAADRDWTRVEVSDAGGFPSELAEEIFRPFTLADMRHHSQGSGLGLALARSIAGACGGSLRARSSGPGTGAQFIVELKHVRGTIDE